MSGVAITFLGTGDAFGSGGRYHTCFLVDTHETRFLIDCGASSLNAMKRHGIDPASIDSILITHLHGDHFAGLPFFLLDSVVSQRDRSLVIAGPVDLERRSRDLLQMLFPSTARRDKPFDLRFVALHPGQASVLDTVTVRAIEVAHSKDDLACALRIDCGGKTIAYSGDTEWTDALIEASKGADLFVCECYAFDEEVPGHMTYTKLLQRRSDLGCGRLVLTHMGPRMLERLPSLEIDAPEDGETITLR